MTYEEVKRIWNNPTAEDVDNIEFPAMVDEAIEKQIPKKVAKNSCGYDCCPICFFLFATEWYEDIDYCVGCGQALDWSDSSSEKPNS